MKIIVCVKQVPDTSGKVAVKADGTMDRAAMDTISNPDDMNALEAALQIKDQNPDVKVVVVSMGPAPTESMLRECLAMGADEAVLVSAREFGGSDTFVTYVTGIEYKDGELTVRRALEDGYMTIKVQTPCLLTCIKELNTPRYMSVPGIMGCYAKPYSVLDFNALSDDPLIALETVGLKGSPTQVYKSFSPPVKGAGTMLEGADKETCEKLVSILGEKHII